MKSLGAKFHCTSKWKHNGSDCVCVCTFVCAYVCLYLCVRVCASVPLFNQPIGKTSIVCGRLWTCVDYFVRAKMNLFIVGHLAKFNNFFFPTASFQIKLSMI